MTHNTSGATRHPNSHLRTAQLPSDPNPPGHFPSGVGQWEDAGEVIRKAMAFCGRAAEPDVAVRPDQIEAGVLRAITLVRGAGWIGQHRQRGGSVVSPVARYREDDDLLAQARIDRIDRA